MTTLKAIGMYIGIIAGISILIATTVALTGSSEGILHLGTTGNGVLICGEAIALNATADISEQELRSMFERAMVLNQEVCATY